MKLQNPKSIIDKPKIDTLSPWDWNFDPVPKSELEVCCLWEYARESAFLHSIRKRSAQAAELRLPREERSKFVEADFMKVFNVLERSSILFQEGIYGFGGDDFVKGFVSRFPVAWQALSSHERSVLIKTTEWDAKETAGFPGFRRGHQAHALALANSFEPKSQIEVFGSDGKIGVREFYHSGHKLRSICPNLLSANGSEILIVKIDWGDFTNDQLVKEFAQWLKENNPPGINRPDGRGHNKIIDSRAKLTRLAVMRLLSRFTLKDILGTRSKNPIAECRAIHDSKQFSSSKWGDPTKWRDARRDAGALFRKLFPFLPVNEKPLSWEKK